MKRILDVVFTVSMLAISAVPMIIVALLVKLTSDGPVLHWSDRVGRNNAIFKMPKFRTMRMGTPAVATHLLDEPERYLTCAGKLLRKFSLDELPQFFSILKGDMSVVGPRPALFNQEDLIALRTSKGVHVLVPGLTGWAQVNGRDNLSVQSKVQYDEYYLRHASIAFDVKVLFITFRQALMGQGVRH